MPLLDTYRRGIRFTTGRINARRDLPAALALAVAGTLDLATVATTVVDWDRAPEVWVEPCPKLFLRR